MRKVICRSLEELLLVCVSHADEGIIPDDDPQTLSFGWYFVESDLSVRIDMSILRRDMSISAWIQTSATMLEKFLRVFIPASRVEAFQEILRELAGGRVALCKHEWVTTIRMTENNGQWTTTKAKKCKICNSALPD